MSNLATPPTPEQQKAFAAALRREAEIERKKLRRWRFARNVVGLGCFLTGAQHVLERVFELNKFAKAGSVRTIIPNECELQKTALNKCLDSRRKYECVKQYNEFNQCLAAHAVSPVAGFPTTMFPISSENDSSSTSATAAAVGAVPCPQIATPPTTTTTTTPTKVDDVASSVVTVKSLR